MLCIMTQVLSNRSQHVVADGCRGKLVNVATEVPLGSVEGLLLFFHYAPEPFFILENKLTGYTDDST